MLLADLGVDVVKVERPGPATKQVAEAYRSSATKPPTPSSQSG
jgi:crotonobetainyl-CoA:carnitine CoA-transferase CaiB-like acyl-CoA transferase